MNNYRIRLLPGVLVPINVTGSRVTWEYQPTGQRWRFTAASKALDMLEIVRHDIEQEWKQQAAMRRFKEGRDAS